MSTDNAGGVTMRLELNDEQVAELSALLGTAMKDLSYEIADTDERSFRDGLKRRREVLQGVLDELRAAAA